MDENVKVIQSETEGLLDKIGIKGDVEVKERQKIGYRIGEDYVKNLKHKLINLLILLN